ncbi:MAG: hypothetical protein ACQGVK_12295 [Myxococcota bacterium]
MARPGCSPGASGSATPAARPRDPRLEPAQLLDIARWKLWSDPAATEAVYAGIDVGGCDRCGCDACFNFAQARHLCFGTDWIDLLEWLGVDPLLESEVVHRGPGPAGGHLYSGWFHLVGEIESGPRRNEGRSGSIDSRHLVDVGGGLQVAFSCDRRLAPAAFDPYPVVELEFALEAPWVCDLPEPS